jgi:uncharacterized repeat protein (TIGR03943 family)
VNRRAQSVVMLLFGAAVVKASATDMYLRYVKHSVRPLLVVGGLLLVTAAVMTLGYDLRATAQPTSVDEEEDREHGRAHSEPAVAWLLILPVLALLLIAPPALGSYSAGQAGSVLSGQNAASDYGPLPAGDPVSVSLLDYASRAVFDEGRSLKGRHLELSGFVTLGPQGEPMLARIVISCCAADGRPIKVGMSGNVPTGVPVGTWIRVVGTYTPKAAKDPINGAAVPYLLVATWQEIAVPVAQYE